MATSQYTSKDIARFWSKVNILLDIDSCWEWQRCKFKNKYGKFSLGGRKGGVVYAHRAAWELTYGAIPTELFVLHKCDNPTCVNPHHLFLGTHQDNVDDMVNKKRNSSPPTGAGESNNNHKLTSGQVAYIRNNYIPKTDSARQLANKFGVGITTIRRVIRHETWKGVCDE